MKRLLDQILPNSMTLLVLISCVFFAVVGRATMMPSIYGHELHIRYAGSEWMSPGMTMDIAGMVDFNSSVDILNLSRYNRNSRYRCHWSSLQQ